MIIAVSRPDDELKILNLSLSLIGLLRSSERSSGHYPRAPEEITSVKVGRRRLMSQALVEVTTIARLARSFKSFGILPMC
jgi:hypothetical protein